MNRRSANVRPDLRASLADGSLSAVATGLGEYLVPFALASGVSAGAAGLLVPLPQMTGAVIALVLPAIIAHIRSIRNVTVSLAAVHAACLAAIAVAAWTRFGGLPATPVLFLIAIVVWTGLEGAAPAWTVWAASLFPRAMRPGYLGLRTRLHHAGVTLGLVSGGLALGWSQNAEQAPMPVFGALFLVAALVRSGSVWFLSRQSEPEPIPSGHRDLSWRELASSMRHTQGGRTLVYMLAFGLASWTAVPHFAPYLLAELELSYTEFMVLITAGFLSRSLVLPSLGVVAKRIGAPRLLMSAAVATFPLAGLWLVSTNFWWLLAVHVLSGVAWASYEISSQLLVFNALPGETRAGALVRFNILLTMTQAGGAVLAFAVLKILGRGEEGYRVLFVISTILRLLTIPLTFRVLRSR